MGQAKAHCKLSSPSLPYLFFFPCCCGIFRKPEVRNTATQTNKANYLGVVPLSLCLSICPFVCLSGPAKALGQIMCDLLVRHHCTWTAKECNVQFCSCTEISGKSLYRTSIIDNRGMHREGTHMYVQYIYVYVCVLGPNHKAA